MLHNVCMEQGAEDNEDQDEKETGADLWDVRFYVNKLMQTGFFFPG